MPPLGDLLAGELRLEHFAPALWLLWYQESLTEMIAAHHVSTEGDFCHFTVSMRKFSVLQEQC